MSRRSFLIIRQDRIGDCVLASGLPRELKLRWPDCRVTMMTRSLTAPLFAHNPHVDEILTDDWDDPGRREPFWSLVGRLRRGRFSHALLLLPQKRYAYAAFCAGIPVRLGHGLKLYQTVTFTREIRTRKSRPGRHEADYALDLARAVGLGKADPTPELHLTVEEGREVRRRREAWSAGDENRLIVGLHATSGQSAPNWPPEVWADLAARLGGDEDLAVVLTDPAPPTPLPEVSGVIQPARSVGLRDGMLNFAALDLLVSASTGPMHICGALGVPTVSLFCPLPACRPDLWGPLGGQSSPVLPRAEYCRDQCPGDPHICDYRGDSGVDPAALESRILELLQSSGSS